ncbi:amidohydrolase [Trinickia terrae]|uniref:Amidohydrolase n=1 Tax=Trinickia terrae TaxID=2571161 RepID=A0A4U1I3Y0_9BURK|nr:amidohydrolase [Trinickia terrae]TKC87935.1 amidohydrolase [Trinickia terrae]
MTTLPCVDDCVLVNASLYTADAPALRQTALVLREGRIAYVGDDATARAGSRPGSRVIDLGGRTVTPGFIDSHVHPIDGFLLSGDCDLAGVDTPEAIFAGLRAAAANSVDGAKGAASGWLLAGNANLQLFGAYPTREMLDAVVPHRPLLVIGHDVHSGWLNTLGMKVAGITAATPDPAGGKYERDGLTGEATGIVHEAALYKLFSLLPQLASDNVPQALAKAQALAHGFGITGWFDALVGERLLHGYVMAREEGALAVQASLGLLASPHAPLGPQIERFRRWRASYDGGNLRLHTVKIFIDGVLESRTAALLEPYADAGGLGMHHWEPGQLNEVAELADRAGFDLHFHTLGDRAVRMALDAIEHVVRANGARDRRPQLAHVQLIHPDDVIRFRRLGAIANIQAAWGGAPPYLLDLYRQMLGDARMARNYVFRSLRNAGALLSGGSDWSVSTMNPLVAIQTAMTRMPPGQPGCAAWLPHESVELPTMLEAYTRNAAWGLRFDARAGVLAAGRDASLAILDRDLFATPVAEIASARVQTTLFCGRVVHGALE